MKRLLIILFVGVASLKVCAQPIRNPEQYNAIPAGTIVAYGGSKDNLGHLEAEGWLLCDGTAYDRSNAKYKRLFDAIGFSWGGNNGNMFNVPDLRGQFLRGVSAGSGVDPDANNRGSSNPGAPNPGNNKDAVGSQQSSQVGHHSHQTGAGNNPPDASGTNYLPVKGEFIKSISTSEFGGAETRPVNKAVYYIIKL